jgi:short-subunit dehydrogenase
MTGRRADVFESLASETGATVVVADLADRSDVSRMLECAATVDILVSNAALPATGPLDDFTVEEIDRALDVNLRAPILLARAAANGMVKRGRGHIVFVSSMAAKTAGPSVGLYAATKAGLRALAFSMREDLRPTGVGVSVICPGPISEAGMWADAGLDEPQFVEVSASSKTGWVSAVRTKSSAEASAGTRSVRRRTNPATGRARRGPTTSSSIIPASCGDSSMAVNEYVRRRRTRVPSPAARRLRTQFESPTPCVDTSH